MDTSEGTISHCHALTMNAKKRGGTTREQSVEQSVYMCEFTVYKLYSEQYCFLFLCTTINTNRRRIANQLLKIVPVKF